MCVDDHGDDNETFNRSLRCINSIWIYSWMDTFDAKNKWNWIDYLMYMKFYWPPSRGPPFRGNISKKNARCKDLISPNISHTMNKTFWYNRRNSEKKEVVFKRQPPFQVLTAHFFAYSHSLDKGGGVIVNLKFKIKKWKFYKLRQKRPDLLSNCKSVDKMSTMFYKKKA